MKLLLISSLILTTASLAGCESSAYEPIPSNPTPDNLSQADMPAYCRGEASAEFGARPQDIGTLPAERDAGMFTVYGQYPAEGMDATFFTCTFSGDGEFIGLDRS